MRQIEAAPHPTDKAHPVDDQNFVTRQESARMAVEQAGIVWPATILPEGTALYESGVAKLTADRARWAKLPDAANGLAVVKAALAAEDRADMTVQLHDLSLRPDTGRLVRRSEMAEFRGNQAKIDGSAMGYDTHAFRQLVNATPGCAAGEAPRGFASALLHLDADERAAVLNRRLNTAEESVMLRSKLSHNGKRLARAFLTARYADVNDIHVAEAIEAGVGADAGNIKLDYRPGEEKSAFELIFPSEVPVQTFVVGDIHYAGIMVSNSETGQGSLSIRAFVMRAACANLTLSSGEGVVMRHIGSADRLKVQMKQAIIAAAMQIEPLRQAIQRSAASSLTGFGLSPSEIIRQLAKKHEVPTERAQAWAQTYESKYAHSPTEWGVTSAITEAAQGAGWWGAQLEEEKIASEVLHTGVRKALGF